jgi:hypothetical protein
VTLATVDNGYYGATVIDLETGEEIRMCIWADDETGEYEQYVPGLFGQPAPNLDGTGKTRRGKTRLKIIPPEGFVAPPKG